MIDRLEMPNEGIGFTDEEIEWKERQPLALKLMSMVEIKPESRVYAHPSCCVDSNINDEWLKDASVKRPKIYDAVLFIDDNPRANWSHQCRYVFLAEGQAISVDGIMPPVGEFKLWRILPQKWNPESDMTIYASSKASRHPNSSHSGWWKVVPEREGLVHVGSRGCIVYAQSTSRFGRVIPASCMALYEALYSGCIHDWQYPITQYIGFIAPKLGSEVIPI